MWMYYQESMFHCSHINSLARGAFQMNMELKDRSEEIMNSLSEAMQFIGQFDENKRKEYLYLIEDIENGLQILRNLRLFNNDTFQSDTDFIIEMFKQYIASADIEFNQLNYSFIVWKYGFIFRLAEESYISHNHENAAKHYMDLMESPLQDHRAIAVYRVAQMNQTSNPMEAYKLFLEAFHMNLRVGDFFLKQDHPSRNYEFSEVEEIHHTTCDFCKEEAKPYFCAETYQGVSYNSIYSPVKLWMYCENCNHMFAYNNPVILSDKKHEGRNFKMMQPKTGFLMPLGDTIHRLRDQSKGNRLLDVGIGGGELLAVAKEYQFNVEGVEIVKAQAKYISELLGIRVEACDFLKYEPEGTFDVLTLGDVIEHIEDPVGTIRKANELLNDDGLLWISTPNYQAAYAQIVGFSDPMWKEAGHLHYFSFQSLGKVLEKNNFKVIDYRMSNRYKGSMEVTAIKKK